MKIPFFVPAATLLAYACAFGNTSRKAPDFTLRIEPRGSTVEVIAQPPVGNHINLEAPAYLQFSGSAEKIKPTTKAEKRVTFLLKSHTSTSFSVSLYLCDDKLSYCEKHEVRGMLESGAKATGPALKPKAAPATPGPKTSSRSKPKSGFLLNEPEEALRLAREQRKPLIIDFFAIWCPPCNMLDTDIFSSKEFSRATRDFILLKLDADSDVSWKLRSRYKIAGYPTVIFASADGDEISRIVGYRKKKDFIQEISKAWAHRTAPVVQLEAKALAGDLASAERLGMMHLERKEYPKAIQWLARVPSREEERLAAELALIEEQQEEPKDEQKKTDKLIPLLSESIRKFPNTVGSIERRLKLIELLNEGKKPEEASPVLKDLIRVSHALIKTPRLLEGQDYGVGDLWATIADAEEQLNEPESARASWASAAHAFASDIPAGAALERGRNLERAYCLFKAGKTQEADQLYASLEKAYPTEFTFFHAHASMKLKLERFAEAETLAERAWKNSYGDNRLRSALLYAKALRAQKKIERAKEVISQTLARAQAPSDPDIRTTKHIQALRDFELKNSQHP